MPRPEDSQHEVLHPTGKITYFLRAHQSHKMSMYFCTNWQDHLQTESKTRPDGQYVSVHSRGNVAYKLVKTSKHQVFSFEYCNLNVNCLHPKSIYIHLVAQILV